MVRTKTFLDGFNDLEKLIETRDAIFRAKMKIERVLVNYGLGSLEDKTILTDEERTKFENLVKALNRANDLVVDKMVDYEKKCVEINVLGIEPEKEESEDTEDVYF